MTFRRWFACHLILCIFSRLSLCTALNFALCLLFILTASIRQGVPGEESEWARCREAVRHEGVEEGHYCTKGKDCRTHANGAASAGAYPPVPIPRHTSLCLPDGHQAAPHSRLGFSLLVLCLYKINDCL